MRRLSLLGRFGIMSAIPIVLLGLVLGQSLDRVIRERALTNAAHSAELIAALAIQPRLSAEELSQGFDAERLEALDRQLGSGRLDREVARVNIWNRGGTVVYSDDRAVIGRTFRPSDELQAALNGRTASELTTSRESHNPGLSRYGPLLEVYVPLRFGADTTPVGAFEIYLPYRPIAEQIARDRLLLYLILAGGLLILYALLFRIVADASNRLRRQAAEKEYQALHDVLTDLPNRTLFHTRLEEAIQAAQRKKCLVAVMIMDLDHFKEINDTLGHHIGDRFLKEIGPRLRAALPQTDTVARLGGDEFAILLSTLPDAAAALQVAGQLLDVCGRRFLLDGLTLGVRASIGIALFPEHGEDADSLLRRAEVAMYRAKQTQAGRELYAAANDPYVPSRLELIGQLHQATQRDDQIVVHYQPKVDLRTGHATGLEALVRWQHPAKGLLYPETFVPLAEHTGLIRSLTKYVLSEAIRQCQVWRQRDMDLSVAVNLSAQDLRDEQFTTEVSRLLQRWGAPPACLELEITENSAMADPVCARKVLEGLSTMGIRIALDDFGTGYSSLAYLRQLPVRELKIDKSFVTDPATGDDIAMIRSIIDLGHNLGLQVVAEGVETKHMWDRLVALGCDLAQGYYVARPMPAPELAAWLASAPYAFGSGLSAA